MTNPAQDLTIALLLHALVTKAGITVDDLPSLDELKSEVHHLYPNLKDNEVSAFAQDVLNRFYRFTDSAAPSLDSL